MLLAGDVGGTKTLLGLFDRDPSASRGARGPRPAQVALHSYDTGAFPSFTAILDRFLHDVAASSPGGPLVSSGRPTTAPTSVDVVEAAVLGVAGPVVGPDARLTNVPWTIVGAEVAARLGTHRVQVMNDLAAMAMSVEALTSDEVVILQEGVREAEGNAAVIAAGTGLGEALLSRIDGRLVPVASEAGHADFAARTDREIELVKMLRERHGRVEVEQVLSGPGLLNLHRFTHRGGECAMLEGTTDADAPARVAQAGLSGRCQQCVEALRMLVSAYGAEAGNLALRGVATSGLYVGGGIAPKILPMLRGGLFMEAFLAKAPMHDLLARVPVKVIVNPQAGLIGAAVRAQELWSG
jgi:glucokinase